MKVYLKNALVDLADAKVSVLDHGLLYGDGIFEGIRLYDGCIFLCEEHLERFEYSAKAIMLNMPWSRDVIREAISATCRANGLKDGYIRLIATRGVGSLGLSINSCMDPNLIVIADKIQLYPQEYYEKGLEIITVPTRRINAAALPPMVKSLNYLNNVLAKIECQQHGYQEAIMLNDQGYIAECTGDNFFIIHKGKLYTPSTSAGALKGITRDFVISIAGSLGVEVVEGNLTRYDAWVADECFLTGTAAEIVPVISIDKRVIGDGRPGPVTQRFLEQFRAQVSVRGHRI